MARFKTIYDFLLVRHCNYSSILYHLFDVKYYCDLEIWLRGHSRLLKLVPFKILGAVSYSPFIVNGRILSVSACMSACVCVCVAPWRVPRSLAVCSPRWCQRHLPQTRKADLTMHLSTSHSGLSLSHSNDTVSVCRRLQWHERASLTVLTVAAGCRLLQNLTETVTQLLLVACFICKRSRRSVWFHSCSILNLTIKM